MAAAKASLGNAGDSAEPLGGGPGDCDLQVLEEHKTKGGSFQFTDPDFNTLLATLTARMGKRRDRRHFAERDPRAQRHPPSPRTALFGLHPR